MSTDHGHERETDERVDQLARGAGAALRHPAPDDGMARVRSSRRRRQTVRAVTAGSAVVLIAVGLFVALDRDSDTGGVVTEPVPTAGPDTVPATGPDTVATTPATTPETTPQVVAPPASEPPTTTTQPTTTTTTVPSIAAGWQTATETFPPLAYDSCCGLNWEGDPSPTVPSDPAAPLATGMYNARSVDGASDDFDDGVLTLELRPYTRCSEISEPSCGDPPYEPTELGVANGAARTIDVALDDSVRVGVHGFACADGQLQLDVQYATGADLAALATELDAAYETAVGGPLRGGTDPAQIAAELAADPTTGFADPGCPGYTDFAWTPPSGPGILTSLYLAVPEGAPAPSALSSAAGRFIRPTAFSVDDSGVPTLYFFAGFQS